MPGVGEAIDVAAGAAELGEAGATLAEGTEAAEGAEGAAEGVDSEGFRTDRWSEEGLSNPTTTGDASAASDANAATEGATTEGESAANTEASGNKPASADDFDPKTGKFKPKGSRSLLNLQSNQNIQIC